MPGVGYPPEPWSLRGRMTVSVWVLPAAMPAMELQLDEPLAALLCTLP